MDNFNKYCKNKNCEHYIEWSYNDGDYEYPCISCKLQEQSHNIDEIAENCPFENKPPITKKRGGCNKTC